MCSYTVLTCASGSQDGAVRDIRDKTFSGFDLVSDFLVFPINTSKRG